ncbi:MAG: hypothetical protein ACLP1D_27800 [Xanthobacteraceae bacterium]
MIAGLVAVAALLAATAASERAQAVSLSSPGAPSAARQGTHDLTAEARWHSRYSWRRRHGWQNRHWRFW